MSQHCDHSSERKKLFLILFIKRELRSNIENLHEAINVSFFLAVNCYRLVQCDPSFLLANMFGKWLIKKEHSSLAGMAQLVGCCPAKPPTRLLVRAHTWVVGTVSVGGRIRSNTSVFLSLSSSLPSPLK